MATVATLIDAWRWALPPLCIYDGIRRHEHDADKAIQSNPEAIDSDILMGA